MKRNKWVLFAIVSCLLFTGCEPICNAEPPRSGHDYGAWEITTTMRWVAHPCDPVCVRTCKSCGHRQYKD